MFDFSNCSTGSKYYDYSNNLVAGKMKMKQLVLLLKNCQIKAKDVFLIDRL